MPAPRAHQAAAHRPLSRRSFLHIGSFGSGIQQPPSAEAGSLRRRTVTASETRQFMKYRWRLIFAALCFLGPGLLRPGESLGQAPTCDLGAKAHHEVVRWDPPPQQVPEYEWKQVTASAAFAPRDGAGALTFHGRMWLIGGWNPGNKQRFP